MALDPDRRRQLHGLKLRALTQEFLGADLREVTGTEAGAVGRAEAPGGGRIGVALAEERPERGLGAALVSAHRYDVEQLHLFAAGAAGVLARRAELFDFPIHVWEVSGRSASVAEARAHTAAPAAPDVPELTILLDLADVDVIVEHGTVIGEVQGLEVARVVATDEGHRLEVGVGAHDREAFSLLHGDVPTPDAIRRVASLVRSHRAPGADPHPLNRLGAERWLRARLIDRPELVGAVTLTPAEPPVVRTNLKEAVPAVARGLDADGHPVVVVTSVGADLDLVPFAADAQARSGDGAELVIAVPARDAHDATLAPSRWLREGVRVAVIDDRWREWADGSSVA